MNTPTAVAQTTTSPITAPNVSTTEHDTLVETATVTTRREKKLTVHDIYWQKMFKSLLEFKKQYGDCHVPPHYADKALSNWVKDQRRQYKLISKRRNHKGVMTPERIDLLERQGFDWNPNMHTCYNARKWRKMFELLSQYKREHGDCNVAITKNMYYQQLGCWVSYQRKQYRLKMSNQPSTMTAEKETMLNSLGFVWDQHPSSSDTTKKAAPGAAAALASPTQVSAYTSSNKQVHAVANVAVSADASAVGANKTASQAAQAQTSVPAVASPEAVKSSSSATTSAAAATASTKTTTRDNTSKATPAAPRTRRETVWMCEKCNFAFFPTMKEAVAHENQCTGVAKK